MKYELEEIIGCSSGSTWCLRNIIWNTKQSQFFDEKVDSLSVSKQLNMLLLPIHCPGTAQGSDCLALETLYIRVLCNLHIWHRHLLPESRAYMKAGTKTWFLYSFPHLARKERVPLWKAQMWLLLQSHLLTGWLGPEGHSQYFLDSFFHCLKSLGPHSRESCLKVSSLEGWVSSWGVKNEVSFLLLLTFFLLWRYRG